LGDACRVGCPVDAGPPAVGRGDRNGGRIGYWCELGCEGRIELREHKGNLFASLRISA
jgi:hypothetical protein